jgi:hypothetical protein
VIVSRLQASADRVVAGDVGDAAAVAAATSRASSPVGGSITVT